MTRHRLAGRLVLLLLSGILLVTAWQGSRSREAPPAGAAEACTCALERLRNGWCSGCGKGYVAGCEIRSRILHEALDAHGHELDPAVMACATCRRMYHEGGFCEACRFGWIDGMAYMSRLTYHLAMGRVRAPETRCALCPGEDGAGWCAGCRGGWAGNVFFEDREEFAQAAHEFERLGATIEASSRCETCALVLLVDGRCPHCRLVYEDGKVIESMPPR